MSPVYTAIGMPRAVCTYLLNCATLPRYHPKKVHQNVKSTNQNVKYISHYRITSYEDYTIISFEYVES
jgi:hypothetical protein